MSPRIFWAGDSTVKQNDYTTYPQTGIGQGMSLFLKKEIFVINYAENGRSTKSFIEEGRLDQIDSELKEGDFLFIQFGHNDEKPDVARHTDAYTTYQENLKKFIEVAHKHKAVPVLITSLYRRLFDENGILIDGTHQNYPDAMIDLGKQLSVPVIDLCSLSKSLIQDAGTEKSKRWFLHIPANVYSHFPDGKQDNSHLQYEGAVTFSGLIANELRNLGGSYEELLLPTDAPKEDAALLKD